MSDDDFHEDHIDFEDDGMGEGFEDFEGGGTSLGEMWRNNPLVKIAVIAGGLITVIGAIILFGGTPEQAIPSRAGGSNPVKSTPGERGISEIYRKALEEENEERLNTAVRNDDSVMPTPIEPAVDRLQLPEEEEVQEDPLERWRRIQEERRRQVAQRKPDTVVANPHAEAINTLANAMVTQMQSILESKKPTEPVHYNVTDPNFLEEQRKKEQGEAAKNGGGGGKDVDIIDILIPAGSIEYAQLLIEANSDIEDGPVLAHLVSGPLAGARLLGKFEVEEELLFIEFNTIVIDGIAQSTQAIALDPDTTLPGMATEVDHRYFSRIILPAAAEFVEGFAEAVTQTETTVVVSDGGTTSTAQPELDTQEEIFKGLEKSAEKVAEILDEESGKVEILVKVHAGTPIGLLFIQPVLDETS